MLLDLSPPRAKRVVGRVDASNASVGVGGVSFAPCSQSYPTRLAPLGTLPTQARKCAADFAGEG